MRGLTAVAGQRGLSAGALLIAAGGLTLYQMTSLVLGPAGSRELHLSLAIPMVDADDLSDAARPGSSQTLGMVVAVGPAPSATSSRQAVRLTAQPRPAATPAPTVVVAPPPALSVPPAPPVQQGRGQAQPPKHHDAD